jgi:hypothetical protein
MRIKALQFDVRLVSSKEGKLIVSHKDDKSQVLKVLMLAKVSFYEKFEQQYLTIYYRTNMMLIMDFETEEATDKYIAKLSKLVEFYQARDLELKQ